MVKAAENGPNTDAAGASGKEGGRVATLLTGEETANRRGGSDSSNSSGSSSSSSGEAAAANGGSREGAWQTRQRQGETPTQCHKDKRGSSRTRAQSTEAVGESGQAGRVTKPFPVSGQQ